MNIGYKHWTRNIPKQFHLTGFFFYSPSREKLIMEGLCGKVMAAPSMRVTLLQEREDKC